MFLGVCSFSVVLLSVVTGWILLFQAPPSTSSQAYCVSPDSEYSITTLNDSLPRALCIRVQDGIFTDVSNRHYKKEEENIIYLDGYILPGLIDAHGHPMQLGEMLASASLYEAESTVKVREKLKDYLENHEGEGHGTKEKWLKGMGWDQAYFGGVMPTADDLVDPILKDLYIILNRVDAHCVWVSHAVLELLPVSLPTSYDSYITTDPGPGVFCDNALYDIVEPFVPKPNTAQKRHWFKSAFEELAKVGLTGVGAAGLMKVEDLRILEEMARDNVLDVRVNAMVECAVKNTFCPEEIGESELVRSPQGMGRGMLHFGGIKLFADGALGSWGAALLEPYYDKPETSGNLLINETELNELVKQWYGHTPPVQINIHAIGDLSVRLSINAFENVLGIGCRDCNSDRRFRIEHAQVIHPEDQVRLSQVGIIPSIQPLSATSDASYAITRLGAHRLTHSGYRMRSLYKSLSRGHSPSSHSLPAPILGSDFPVDSFNPLAGVYAAVRRLDPRVVAGDVEEKEWYEEESLDMKQALEGFTKNVAFAWGKEDAAGSIAPGRWADWVLLDGDVWADEGSAKSLKNMEVKGTWVAGRRTFPKTDDEVSRERSKTMGERVWRKVWVSLITSWSQRKLESKAPVY